MQNGIDLKSAQFCVELKAGPPAYRLGWPTDRYYDLVQSPVQVRLMDVNSLAAAAHSLGPWTPDTSRLAFLRDWFAAAAAGQRSDWPPMPVLVSRCEQLEFVDGRHRCEALVTLGAARIPVVIGT